MRMMRPSAIAAGDRHAPPVPGHPVSGGEGYFRLNRGWDEADWLTRTHEPFDRRSAWVWLIQHARFSDEEAPSGGRQKPLARGQLSYSLTYLAHAWKWDVSKVRRLLVAARSATQVRLSTDTGRVVITIVNYSRFQDAPGQVDTPLLVSANVHRTPTDTNKNKGKEGKKERVLSPGGDSRPAGPPEPEFGPDQGQQDLASADVIPMPADEIRLAIEAWNAKAEQLALPKMQVDRSTEIYRQTRPKLQRVLRERGGLAGFKVILDRLDTALFCQGRNDRRWRASLPFLVKVSKIDSLLAGCYDRPGRMPEAETVSQRDMRHEASQAAGEAFARRFFEATHDGPCLEPDLPFIDHEVMP